MDRSSTQKVKKESLDLNYKLYLMDLTDIYRIFHLTAIRIYILVKTHGTFSRLDHMLSRNSTLKTSYTTIKWDSSLGFKGRLSSKANKCDRPH